MTRQSVMDILRSHIDDLQSMGVKSLSLFGSTARNEALEDSDVDLLVEFDRPVGLIHLFSTEEAIEKLLGGTKVDLVVRRTLRLELQQDVFQEEVRAI